MEGLRQVAAALDYAHARGLVHRDGKPANILIGRTAGFKIADFGIVKILDEEAMTQTGATMGTPSYTSPEQLRGERVSGRSDQFSLAVAGIPSAHRWNAVPGCDAGGAIFPDCAGVEAEDISRLNPTLCPDVDRAIRKAMAKAPEQRFASCVDFMDALRTERFRNSKLAVAFFALLAVAGRRAGVVEAAEPSGSGDRRAVRGSEARPRRP